MAFLQINGHTLEYVWHGPAPEAAPTLVFLHEGLGSVSAWRDFPERLGQATGRGALVFSRRGYGHSAPLAAPFEPTFLDDEARGDLPALLRALEVRSAILVGHSDGGSIALKYASDRGADSGKLQPSLQGIITEAAHVFVEEITVRSIARLRDRIGDPAFVERFVKHHGSNAGPILAAWTGAWLDARFRDYSLVSSLPQIVCPALVIQGAEDEYGTLAQVRAIEAGVKGPVETLVLPECGHAPHRDQTAAVLEAMKRFVISLGA